MSLNEAHQRPRQTLHLYTPDGNIVQVTSMQASFEQHVGSSPFLVRRTATVLGGRTDCGGVGLSAGKAPGLDGVPVGTQ